MSERNRNQRYRLSRNKDGSINSAKLEGQQPEELKKQPIDGYPSGKIARASPLPNKVPAKPKSKSSEQNPGVVSSIRKKFTEEHLFDSWKKQSDALEKEPSLKEEFGINKGKAKLKQVAKKHKPNNVKVKKKTRGDGTNIIINFKMPKFSKPNINFGAVTKKQKIITGSALAVALLVTVLIVNNGNSKELADGQVSGEKHEALQLDAKPEYAVLSPGGTGVGHLGGYAKISPPDTPPVYTYKDDIVAVPITVSQQQLPDTLKEDQAAKFKELAEQFNAKDEIFVGENTAYVGTSVKGPQSVVFIKGNILMLIASDTKVSNKDWVEYLATLKF